MLRRLRAVYGAWDSAPPPGTAASSLSFRQSHCFVLGAGSFAETATADPHPAEVSTAAVRLVSPPRRFYSFLCCPSRATLRASCACVTPCRFPANVWRNSKLGSRETVLTAWADAGLPWGWADAFSSARSRVAAASPLVCSHLRCSVVLWPC